MGRLRPSAGSGCRAVSARRRCWSIPAPRPWRWPPCLPDRAGRRGHPSVLHLRLHRQCLRAARGPPVFVDVRAGHAEHRRAQDRARRQRRGPGRSSPCTMRASAARWRRSWASPGPGLPLVEDAAQGLRAATAAGRSAASARLGAISFHETKNVICGEGGALWSTPAPSTAPRSSARRAPTARSSSTARSTSTPGWTSARPTCPARSQPPFSAPSSRRGRHHGAPQRALCAVPRGRSRSWNRRGRAPAALPARGAERAQVLPAVAERPRRDGFMDDSAAGHAGGIPLRAAAQLVPRPAVRQRRGEPGRSPRTSAPACCGCPSGPK